MCGGDDEIKEITREVVSAEEMQRKYGGNDD